jgi:uncharacterized membrane protein YjdF
MKIIMFSFKYAINLVFRVVLRIMFLVVSGISKKKRPVWVALIINFIIIIDLKLFQRYLKSQKY